MFGFLKKPQAKPARQITNGTIVKPNGPLRQVFPSVYSYLDRAEDYDMREADAPGDPPDFEKLDIIWVTPDFELVSGGMRIAFELMRAFEERGHRITLHIFGDTHFQSGAEAKQLILDNYCHINADVQLGIETAHYADVLICAGWQCAWGARNYMHARKKFYLIQDYEAHLYAMGSEHSLTLQTLDFSDFYGLSLGPWVEQVSARLGMPSTPFDFAIDDRYFHPQKGVKRDPGTIVFYARYVTPRRAFELGVVALDIVKKARPDVQIVMHGWHTPSSSVPFEFIDLGIMNDADRARLYAESTVGMALSLTNASMVPLEMMACELPVVELKGNHTEVFYGSGHDAFISLADPHPRKIAEALIDLLDNPAKRQARIAPGHAFLAPRTWERAADVVESAVKRELKSALEQTTNV